MIQLDLEQELTNHEKKLELQNIDDWSRTRIKKDWNEAAKQSRLAILNKYNSPISAPAE